MSSAEFVLDISSAYTSDFLSEDRGPRTPPDVPDTTNIAPWSEPDDEPPTPPPKQGRTFGKASFSSFSLASKASTSNLLGRGRNSETNASHIYGRGRNSETSSFGETMSTDGLQPPREIRKSKSSRNIFKLMRSKSKPRALAPSSAHDVPPLPSPEFQSFQSVVVPPPSPPPPMMPRIRGTRKKAQSATERPSLEGTSSAFMYPLDTNLDHMDGIIKFSPDNAPKSPPQQDASSMSSVRSSRNSFSDQSHSLHHYASTSATSATTVFSDPFAPTDAYGTVRRPARLALDAGKVSPRTIVKPARAPPAPPVPPPVTTADGRAPSPTWAPPESWAVGDEQENENATRYSSSEDEAVGPAAEARRRKRRTTQVDPVKAAERARWKPCRIRVYRANNTYHIVAIGRMVTVSELIPQLNKKLVVDQVRDPHRLYIRERGRERLLAMTEKPADILRRRLEQAGYDKEDGLDILGQDDQSFLLRFYYKSTKLGAVEEDYGLDSYEYVNLNARSLKIVPVVLYVHADEIVVLDLSRNPMLDIPLDFIQACTTLRELRLSNMAMKKVPHSIRHCLTLNRLDLTCNRIGDLDDSELEQIPDLQTLRLENNRMERLPWSFARLRVRFLNISNNKFRHIPAVVCEMTGLQDLDISFNMISELPEEIGQLLNLESLIMVGNQVSRFPEECRRLTHLRILDCRRNNISDLTSVCMLPSLETLKADHNTIHGLQLSLGPSLASLEVSRNDVTLLTLVPGPVGHIPYVLTTLDVSHAKLSSLDEDAFAHLVALETLKLDHNSFRFLPESIGDLSRLSHLSCSNNQLDSLPYTLGQLQRLEHLDVNTNSLKELPAELWNCASLVHINATSNLLEVWNDPPPLLFSSASSMTLVPGSSIVTDVGGMAMRKISTTGSFTGDRMGRGPPPLTYSLERLYLGENQFTDDVLRPLTVLKELRVLNLSFNDLQAMPSTFFKNLTKLEELYLSGNKLSSIPTEDLHKLTRLTTLYLNGNQLQSLPTELGKVPSLTTLDVGSNILRYNINNWEYDWNWNFNPNLRYLNLSANKRLEIRSEAQNSRMTGKEENERILSDFDHLPHLRVLGLMDVTTTFMKRIPDESEDRRVRTSLSEVNGMAYGIADTLGRDHITMFDLVQPEFRNSRNETIFAMFGRASPFGSNNKLSKYLHDNFLTVFEAQLQLMEDDDGPEAVPHALRRTFLKLNKYTYEHLLTAASTSRKMSATSVSTTATGLREIPLVKGGASGIVAYLVEKTLYVANAGNALAVVSRHGTAHAVSKKHDPFDREETTRIRAAEGWVSPKGLVNDEIDLSRSFGFYSLSPIVNPRPAVYMHTLDAADEFLIIANRGLWDYVPFQTAVDIARSERADPMIAAQKLRDFAISYGADGSIMIMVISFAGLFRTNEPPRKATLDILLDPDAFAGKNRRRKDEISDRNISRLDTEVPAPTGHLAIVFTDIRNSTHLWDVNPGMPTAIKTHNTRLRRELRLCGGYEVKTEGDAFMVSFPTALAALWWALKVQLELLHENWPLEILECEDGKEIHDADGQLIARGLSVRMGIHVGAPICERDPINRRMDYFGPMVNRSARVTGNAAGGQIMCSRDILSEINAKIFETEPETEHSWAQPSQAIAAIREMGLVVIDKGPVQLKGIELPEHLSLLFPKSVAGRQFLGDTNDGPNASGSRIQFSVDQMRELAMLCVRLETLSSSRVLRPTSPRKGSTAKDEPPPIDEESTIFVHGDPTVLLPAINEKASDREWVLLLDSLSLRIENALASLALKRFGGLDGGMSLLSALERHGGCNGDTLTRILTLLGQC